jgi:Glycosyl hydrolase family 3 C-terminal domain
VTGMSPPSITASGFSNVEYLRESEGYDRTTLDLPGRTNELIRRVAEVNPKTVVVTQSVSKTHMVNNISQNAA